MFLSNISSIKAYTSNANNPIYMYGGISGTSGTDLIETFPKGGSLSSAITVDVSSYDYVYLKGGAAGQTLIVTVLG